MYMDICMFSLLSVDNVSRTCLQGRPVGTGETVRWRALPWEDYCPHSWHSSAFWSSLNQMTL